MSDEDYIFCCDGESKTCRENGRCYDTGRRMGKPLTNDKAFEIGYERAIADVVEWLRSDKLNVEEGPDGEVYGILSSPKGLAELIERGDYLEAQDV